MAKGGRGQEWDFCYQSTQNDQIGYSWLSEFGLRYKAQYANILLASPLAFLRRPAPQLPIEANLEKHRVNSL
jgi:hypothetical protein